MNQPTNGGAKPAFRFISVPAAVLIAMLGFALLMVGYGEITATRWTVSNLRYDEVVFHRGFRTGPSLHLKGSDGETYLLSERLWGATHDGRALASRLARDSVATLRVSGGRNRLIHGYPSVQLLEVGDLRLEAPASAPWSRWVKPVLGALLLITGAAAVRRHRTQAAG